MKLTIQKPFHTTSYSITTNSRHMYEWLEIAYGEYATNVAQATHNIHIDVLNGFQSKVCVDGLELTVRDPVDYGCLWNCHCFDNDDYYSFCKSKKEQIGVFEAYICLHLFRNRCSNKPPKRVVFSLVGDFVEWDF